MQNLKRAFGNQLKLYLSHVPNKGERLFDVR